MATGMALMSQTKTALKEIMAGNKTPIKYNDTQNLQLQKSRQKKLVNVNLGRIIKKGISQTPSKNNTPLNSIPTSVGK